MNRWFQPEARIRVEAALEAAVPGSVAHGAGDYVEELLTALEHEPPHIWAAPGSGDGSAWLSLGPWEHRAWEMRIERWRSVYARVADGTADDADRRVVFEHACEATYGDPAYGGNRSSSAWAAVSFPEPMFPPRRSAR